LGLNIAANGVGQLASVTDPSGTSSYTYDAYSRMTSKTTTINAINGAPAQTKTISYTRDSTGKVTSMTYPSGKVLAITYSQGRANAMTLNAAPLISGIQYFPFGGPESWLLGAANSTKEYTRIIDQSSRTQQYTTPSGFRTISYDNASRIVGISNYTGATLNGSQTFTYDNAGRLTTFSGYTSNGVNATTGLGNAAITQTQSFAYDSNGNRTSSTVNSIASTYSYQAGNNRLSTVTGGIIKTNTYDATGNLTNDGAQTYTYDARGRLTGATVPANTTAPTTNYLINYQGLRVKKANANTATTTSNRTFIYDDDGKMLGEYDHAGNAVQELIWLGDTPIAVTGNMPCLTSTTGANGTPTCTEAATAYIFTDHLNTPREVARINSTTNAYLSLWKWDSLPFGETQPNENPSSTGIFSFNHRFPGQYKDKETGLNQNWFRDYDATVGRYVQSDPTGLDAGINTYIYVGNKPISHVDLMGLFCTCAYVAALKSTTQTVSQGRCARAVRIALEAGGADTKNRPVDAKNYGPLLESNGFSSVSQIGYTAQAGDTAVFASFPGGSVSGHIQGFTGSTWVSDFVQPRFFPSRSYEKADSYTIYRPPAASSADTTCGCN
jgi:RHS repeat-associated protein